MKTKSWTYGKTGGARVPILLGLLAAVLVAIAYFSAGDRGGKCALEEALNAGYNQLTSNYMQMTMVNQAAPDAQTLAEAVPGMSGALTTTFTAETGKIRVDVKDAQGNTASGTWPMP